MIINSMDAMWKAFASLLVILSLLVSIAADEDGYSRCTCDEEGYWSIDTIMQLQKAGDFMIAAAYFSIPIELLYFISCSSVPFKLVLFEFIAFIVLCGMTHLLNGWTYGPHTFQLMLAVTIFKILTALVSVATSITLLSLIPMLLKVKVREFLLKKKAHELGREVGLIKRKKEAGLHVRMLTQEIRKSLDRHTILYTTLVELSKTLNLQNSAIWMPNESRTEMNLTHESKGRNSPDNLTLPIPISDSDVQEIKKSDKVQILEPDSPLAVASTGGTRERGVVAAIRMPMLSVCNFKGGTPKNLQSTCYAILVLVLPLGQDRSWSVQEIEIVKVVADQVAVALSHAAVLEESQFMREKLIEQNRALLQAKQEALMARQAKNAFHMVMSNGLRRPMHSILGLLSMMQEEKVSNDQRLIVDSMVKTGNVLSTLINDVMATSTKDSKNFLFERRSFQLHSTIREATCLVKCLCAYRGFEYSIEVDRSLPNHVMGDERRVIQVILHMVGNLMNGSDGGIFSFRVFLANRSYEKNDLSWGLQRPDSSEGHVYVRFEIGVSRRGSKKESLNTSLHYPYRTYFSGVEEDLSSTVCRKLVQLMEGDIWVVPNSGEFDQGMVLVLRFQIRPPVIASASEFDQSSDHSNSNTLFRGMHVLVADNDDVNRAVTRKLLQKLGCIVTAVSSGYECLSALGPTVTPFQVVLLDLHLPDLDGFEITQRIRKFRSRSWPLIVALTANDDEDIWGQCVQIGMNGVIQKPVLLQGIADELRRVLLQSIRIMS